MICSDYCSYVLKKYFDFETELEKNYVINDSNKIRKKVNIIENHIIFNVKKFWDKPIVLKIITPQLEDISTSHKYEAIFNAFFEQFFSLYSMVNTNFIDDQAYKDAAMDVAYEKAICIYITGGSCSNILYKLIQKLKKWNLKTYEGKKMVFGVIIDPDDCSTADESLDYINFLDNKFSAVFSDGEMTAVFINKNGKLIQHKTLDPKHKNLNDSKKTLINIGYESFTQECKNNKVGVLLTKFGYIMIIKNQMVNYVYKNGEWVYYNYNEFLNIIYKKINSAILNLTALKSKKYLNCLIDEIYCSLLDMSLSKEGTVIAIIKKNRQSQKCFVNLSDMEHNPIIRQKKCFIKKSLVNTNFINTSREQRKELLSQDGALIMNYKGEILACGEIVKVQKGSSSSGGRTKATKELAKYGVAIKVSEDGSIECYSKLDNDKFYSIK